MKKIIALCLLLLTLLCCPSVFADRPIQTGRKDYEMIANGLFVLRKVKRDGTVKDKVRYRNGSGLLYYSFDENVLYWTDYTLKPEKRVRSFIKTASPDADEAM